MLLGFREAAGWRMPIKREDEFKAWLKQRGSASEKARNVRTYAVRKIEQSLQKLGLQFGDLEDAWQADRFVSLRQRLKDIQDDASSEGQDYRVLMPEAKNPHNRLTSWMNWLGLYGRFLSGEAPTARKDIKDADLIRQHVLEHYIEPAREEDLQSVDVLVRDVNAALGLNEAWPNICQALKGTIFQELANVGAPEQIGADQSSATVFRFSLAELTETSSGKKLLFFDSAGSTFQPVRNFNRATGVSAFRIKPRGAGNSAAEAVEIQDIVEVARAMLVDGLASRIKALSGGPVNYLTYGGDKLVRYELDPAIAKAIGVPPNGHVGELVMPEGGIANDVGNSDTNCPTNLILYGPPGTGKTFATAEEAVRLCAEPVPQDRTTLMSVYQRLLAAGRIEFVTFHQSMTYEDFVEGRQPTTASDEFEGTPSVGFRLETVPGLFRRIAKRAETSRGRKTSGDVVTVAGRNIFKMSIGEANNPDDAHLFEEAIEDGVALIGFGEFDWSDAKFATREAFIEAWKNNGDENASGLSGGVQMPFMFRNVAAKGDLVIVSKGNSLVRAIGEFTGDYEFKPRPQGEYAHRRSVRWLWIDREGISVSEIYSRNFMQKSIYKLINAEVNIPALERYMNSQQTGGSAKPESFVLIIDEINRANISKVFGELITLLEPDKRLGLPNELKVRLPYSGDEFGVPANLNILGTMNTADRSIALLDTALRRRFQFREMMPDPSLLVAPASQVGVDLPRLLSKINERIEFLFDREHQIGHAYFIGCRSLADLDDVMRHKVIPLLAEYFFEDWAKIAAVLGDLESHERQFTGGFLRRTVLRAPPGFSDEEGQVRFRWEVRSASEGFDYSKLTAP